EPVILPRPSPGHVEDRAHARLGISPQWHGREASELDVQFGESADPGTQSTKRLYQSSSMSSAHSSDEWSRFRSACSCRSCSTTRGRKFPRAVAVRSRRTSRVTPCRGPRIQSARGTEKPCFGRCKRSSGTRPRRAALRPDLVVVLRTLESGGSRAAI